MFIDSLALATEGYSCRNIGQDTLALATQGYTCRNIADAINVTPEQIEDFVRKGGSKDSEIYNKMKQIIVDDEEIIYIVTMLYSKL